MRYRVLRTLLYRATAAALCGLLLAGAAGAAEKAKKAKKAAAKPAATEEAPIPPSKLPWSLRAQYGITYSDTEMKYSADNAEWTLLRNGKDVLVDNVGMTVTLADGTVVNIVDFTQNTHNFEDKNDGNLGPYRRFFLETKPHRGLVLRHSLYRHQDKPFMLLKAELVNAGDKPVTITQVAPAVMGPKGMALSPETVLAQRSVTHRGGYVLYDPSASRFALFSDPTQKFNLAMGIFPEEAVPCAVAFEKQGEAWHGRITCDYSPGHVLEPGESLKVAPLWLSFFMPEPESMTRAFAASLSSLPQGKKNTPRAWVTVAPDAPSQSLTAAAEAWAGSNVKHALVPAPWAGRDGYPYDPRATASALKRLGMAPGIAVDPLGVQGAPENFTVAGPDGRRWINPALPEARAHTAEQLKQLDKWGYEFFVAPPSGIPDEALQAAGLSRAEADELAMEIAATAAGDKPILPAPAATLGSDIDEWLKAAAVTARAAAHGAAVGPVRVDVSRLGDISDGLEAAMALYPGPVEIVGTPASGVPRKVKGLLPRPTTVAVDIDAAAPIPKLWQAQQLSQDGPRTHAVLAFPGAPEWSQEDLEPGFTGTVKTRRVGSDGKISEDRGK